MLDPNLAAAVHGKLLSDMHLDLKNSSETMFFMMELSDAMKRGVRHYKLDGTPLERLETLVEALIFDGEIFFDEAQGAAPVGH